MEGVYQPRSRNSYTSVGFIEGELWCRLPDKEQDGTLDGHVQAGTVQGGDGVLPGLSHTGCLCIQENSSTPEILFMASGQLSSGEGCSADQVGLCHLPVPTSPTPHQGLVEVLHGEVYGSVD